MITLALLHPLQETPVQKWTFTQESAIGIGRANDNQVILYSAVVSRHHVELRQNGSQWEVVNLGTNGTYLNGERIDHLTVTDGIVIRLARSGPMIQIRLNQDLVNAPPPTAVDLPDNSDQTQNSEPNTVTIPLSAATDPASSCHDGQSQTQDSNP